MSAHAEKLVNHKHQSAKTILLTGATGFLGSHLAHSLVAKGHRLLVLKRPASSLGRIASVLPFLTLYDIQGTDLSGPFKNHGKVDAVIHTATCNGRSGESVGEIFEANTAFPLRLLETAASFNVRTFLNSDTILDRHMGAYALSKRHFAEWGRLFAEDNNIRFVNIRLEHIYGPGDDISKLPTRLIRECLSNVPEIRLTAGEQKRDFVYVDDVVAGYEILLDQSDNQAENFLEYGLGSGKAVTIREFTETIHKLSGSTSFLNFGALPYRKNEIMHSVANTVKLMGLGWQCRTNLIEGIENTIFYEINHSVKQAQLR